MNSTTEYITEGKIFHGYIPHVMGTRLEMLIIGKDEDDVVPLWSSLHEYVFKLDGIMNRFAPESEVSALNLSDNPREMPMSDELAAIVELSEEYNNRTDGLFDVTDENGKFDFGGFGKGYFLRRCKAILLENNVQCAFVDFGSSSILCMGHHPYGDAWPIGITDPYTRLTVKEIMLADASMSTSGNTPSYSGHIRNPRTGEVCEGRRMITVVSDDPLDAEILTTTLMIAPENEVESIMSRFPSSKIEVIK